MWKFLPVLFLAFVGVPFQAGVSQTITESWLRTATSSCGGGRFEELEGEFEASLFKKLGLISGGAEGEGRYEMNDVKNILDEFEGESKERADIRYKDCLLQLINMASTPEGIPPKDIVLDSDFVPPDLAIVPKGKRFLKKQGDLIALESAEFLISFSSVHNNGPTFLFTNSITGESQNFQFMKEGEVMSFVGCNVIPYEIDNENGTTALFSICE